MEKTANQSYSVTAEYLDWVNLNLVKNLTLCIRFHIR